MRTSILFLALVGCACALSLQPFLGHRVPFISVGSIGQELRRRQVPIGSVSSVPSQCSTSCGSANDEIILGCPTTACCTTTFETEYYNCLECVGSAQNETNYTVAQNSLNLLYTTCVDIGFVLPQLVLPGQTANGSDSSASSTSAGSSALSPASSAGSGTVTNAAGGRRWRRGLAEFLISAAVSIWLAGLW